MFEVGGAEFTVGGAVFTAGGAEFTVGGQWSVSVTLMALPLKK